MIEMAPVVAAQHPQLKFAVQGRIGPQERCSRSGISRNSSSEKTRSMRLSKRQMRSPARTRSVRNTPIPWIGLARSSVPPSSSRTLPTRADMPQRSLRKKAVPGSAIETAGKYVCEALFDQPHRLGDRGLDTELALSRRSASGACLSGAAARTIRVRRARGYRPAPPRTGLMPRASSSRMRRSARTSGWRSVQLHLRIRRDHRTDVAPVEHRSARRYAKSCWRLSRPRGPRDKPRSPRHLDTGSLLAPGRWRRG